MVFSFRLCIPYRRVLALAAVALAANIPLSAHADSGSRELAAALRQLNALERLIEHTAEAPIAPGERYYFDYSRLLADLARVRAGIEIHLSPSRAQPRDPVALSGDYRVERTPTSQAKSEAQP